MKHALYFREYTHTIMQSITWDFKLTFWDAESLLVLLETFETLQERL